MQLYNPEPSLGKQRQGGWKTILGYAYQAKWYKSLLMSNRPYDWHVILILPSMSLEEHQVYWRVMSKRLTQSRLNLVWIREITLENRLHYHCLVKSSLSKENLRKCFEAATPSEITLRVSPIDSEIGLIEYLLKLGKFKRKRVYFSKESTLNKHGVIGHPFSVSLKEHRQKVICRERRMTAALAPWAEYFNVPLAELRCAFHKPMKIKLPESILQ